VKKTAKAQRPEVSLLLGSFDHHARAVSRASGSAGEFDVSYSLCAFAPLRFDLRLTANE
jgi:hypothetical protein